MEGVLCSPPGGKTRLLLAQPLVAVIFPAPGAQRARLVRKHIIGKDQWPPHLVSLDSLMGSTTRKGILPTPGSDDVGSPSRYWYAAPLVLQV